MTRRFLGLAPLFALIFLSLTLGVCEAKPDGIQLDGSPMNLSSYKGKWVLINFWASWCRACQQEIPDLNAFNKKHDNVQVFAVNFDKLPKTEVEKFSKALGFEYPSLMDFSAKKFGVNYIRGLPTTLVFSPEGKLVKVLEGAGTEADFERYTIRG